VEQDARSYRVLAWIDGAKEPADVTHSIRSHPPYRLGEKIILLDRGEPMAYFILSVQEMDYGHLLKLRRDLSFQKPAM
jgi:hypothetical protein